MDAVGREWEERKVIRRSKARAGGRGKQDSDEESAHRMHYLISHCNTSAAVARQPSFS
jgi:hypothetical protein